MAVTRIKLEPGASHPIVPNRPIIDVVAANEAMFDSAYVWIGNFAPDDKWCYATAPLSQLKSFLGKFDKNGKRRG